ncbi:hypothetical protein BHE90_004237 [Fusarium euwallaceae]|uniref:Uncharacterized protein n=1 Tax=Fusarium euwallaceae TaxID=1147111 RepID=A0A430LZU6_9HYPO|nr:hypothetical protein BHE90_004237 [Fusarium euwallaceae]
MAELALGAIGVVPVVEFVFKSLRGLYRDLKTFKRYTREAKRVQQELEVQEAIFKNEWQILRTVFLPAADDSNAPDVAGHIGQRKLDKLQLDQRLRRVLGENYNACEKATAVIGEDLQELTNELQDVTFLANNQGNERPGDTIQRLREIQDRLKVTFRSNKWSESIEKLRRSIGNLSTLRAQLEKLGKPARPDFPMALDEIIKTSRRDLINPIDKLRLARILVSAALKFYSTPWLDDIWQLRDLSMSVDDIEDLSKSIHNMHLSAELGKTRMVQMEDVQTVATPNSHAAEDDARDDEEIRCNIKCRPLWSLGVALLQIDHWAKIDLGDVVAVRRAAARTSQISPKYRELTQRCLECDFGRRRGQDLSKSPLHQAVYKVVLGELDRLLSLKEQEMSPMEVSDEGDELGYYN